MNWKNPYQYAICNLCGAKVIARNATEWTLGSIRTHSASHQITSKKPNSTGVQLSVQDSYGRSPHKKLKSKEERRQDQVRATSEWVADANVPLSSTERPSFQRMIQSYDAAAPPISAMKIKNNIIEMDEDIRKTVISKMKGCHVNLTIDHWTSKQNVNYVGMTAHWIDSEWKLHSLPLGMFLHEGRTTASAVFEKLLEDISREIKEVATIFAVTTDTDAAMNLLGVLLEKDNIWHLYCTDHVFHLTCKLCYENSSFGGGVVINAVQKATNIVSYFNKSTQAVEKIKRAQQVLEVYGGSTPVKPLTDVVTRWWSTYQMCNRIRYLKHALGSMFGGGDLPVDQQLSEDDWDSLSSVITILKPFRSSQQFLEGEKYVTSCYVVPTVFECREGLRKGQLPGVPQSVRNLSKVLSKDFDGRWGASTGTVFTGNVVRGPCHRQLGIHPAFCHFNIPSPIFQVIHVYGNGCSIQSQCRH